MNACEIIDRINEFVGKGGSWLTLFLILLVSGDVLSRYLFQKTSVAVQELEWHIFALVFLLAAGYTLKNNAHVRVDFFYQRLGKRGKAFIDLVGCILFLIPGCILVMKSSLPFVESSWAFQEGSPDPGGLPARYILKAAIPVGFFLVFLQGLALLARSALTFFAPEDPARKND